MTFWKSCDIRGRFDRIRAFWTGDGISFNYEQATLKKVTEARTDSMVDQIVYSARSCPAPTGLPMSQEILKLKRTWYNMKNGQCVSPQACIFGRSDYNKGGRSPMKKTGKILPKFLFAAALTHLRIPCLFTEAISRPGVRRTDFPPEPTNMSVL